MTELKVKVRYFQPFGTKNPLIRDSNYPTKTLYELNYDTDPDIVNDCVSLKIKLWARA